MLSKSTIKYIQSLQHKKFRDEHRSFVAEGPKVVGELLTSGLFEVKHIYATEGFANWLSPQVVAKHMHLIETIADFELEKIANYSSPNKVVAEFEQLLPGAITHENNVSVLLDDIQDPGNLGTIIRTADWFGIKQIICSPSTVDVYNPKVVQSTMASIGKVNIVYTDLKPILERKEVPAFAATLTGGDVSEMKKIQEGLILIGNESKGIHPDLVKLCDKQISIAKKGNAESLNAAIAFSIIAYALT